MNKFLVKLTLPFLCALAITACKSENQKTAVTASAPPVASATAPVKNTLQPSFSGDYATLAIPQTVPQGRKVEVLEFFGYFCSHCRSFDPLVTAWANKNKRNVMFKRVPVGTSSGAVAQQRMYYALEAMGKLESLHPAIFKAYQEERLALSSEGEVLAYVVKKGVDKSSFLKHYQSAETTAKVEAAHKVAEAYLIESVPTLALDGRYLTSPSHAFKRPGTEKTETGLQRAVLAIADDLLAQSLKERQATK